MILHVVLYQPKPSATPEELSGLVKALEVASREIPSIRQVRVGRAVDLGFSYSNWSKDQNSLNVAVFEFEDLDALKAYLTHEAHQRLAALFWSTCDKPTIIDVSALDPTAHDLEALFGQMGD